MMMMNLIPALQRNESCGEKASYRPYRQHKEGFLPNPRSTRMAFITAEVLNIRIHTARVIK